MVLCVPYGIQEDHNHIVIHMCVFHKVFAVKIIVLVLISLVIHL